MKHFSYYIIGREILLISLLICSIICLYYQSQTINKQRESIKELTSKYYKCEEYKEAIKLEDIIFDNNNIWNNDNSEIMNEYIKIRNNIDNTFYKDFHNNELLDSISYMYNEQTIIIMKTLEELREEYNNLNKKQNAIERKSVALEWKYYSIFGLSCLHRLNKDIGKLLYP